MRVRLLIPLVAVLLSVSLPAQLAVVPHILRYSAALPQPAGALEGGEFPVSFALYATQSGGEPIWQEVQWVKTDSAGRYTVLLGSASEGGVPESVFADGEARWVGVTLSGQQELPRTPLTATAYALKAEDAASLGGHPAADFVLAVPGASTPVTQINTSNGVLGGGTGPAVNLQLDTSFLENLGNSLYPQKNAVVSSLTGASGVIVSKSGTAYSATLDTGFLVNLGNTVYPQLAGANSFHGNQTLGAAGTATASASYNSYAERFVASAYNTTVGAPEPLTFGWQAEPAGNDTAAPSASLNLTYGAGANAQAETGLRIASNGILTFASGQTFPGASSGTITGVTAGTDLFGGGSSGNVTLSLDTSSLQTANDSRYAQLAANNTFSGANTFNGSSTLNGYATLSNGAGITSSDTDYYALQVSGEYPAGFIGNAGGSALIAVIGSSYSSEGSNYVGKTASVVTDSGSDGSTYGALLATATSNYSGYFASYGGYSIVLIKNDNTAAGQIGVEVRNTDGTAFCRTYLGNGTQENIDCTGGFNADHASVTGRVREFYTTQSTENWMEDYGTGHLSAGRAVITLDTEYAGMLEEETGYHVFLTPNGDCKGLYITAKTPATFEVREMGGGTASLDFDYKIVGHRRGMAGIRMRDVTDQESERRSIVAEGENRVPAHKRPERYQVSKAASPRRK